MSNKVLKLRKASLYEFTQNYSNKINNCIEFFGTLTVAEPLILKNVDYNVIFLSNFLF